MKREQLLSEDNTIHNIALDNTFPFLKLLFIEIKQISSIYIAEDFMTILKENLVDWPEGNNEEYIAETVKDIFDKNNLYPLVFEQGLESNDNKNDQYFKETDDIVFKIKSLLDEKARPHAQADGGDILFEKYDASEKIVYVSMLGACAGCSSSTITLKFMITNMLTHYFPDQVVDVKDIDEDNNNSSLDDNWTG